MDFSLTKMLVFMITLTTILNFASAWYGYGGGQTSIDTNALVNTAIANEPDPVLGFLGPLMLVWDYIRTLVSYFDAMANVMNTIGAPEPFYSLFVWGWRGAWILTLVGFIRGVKP